MTPDLETLKLLGEAVALGLLVGVERYRGRDPGEKKSAGVRTFTIFCLLGALCGIFATTAFTVVTFAAVTGLVLLGYHRSPSDSIAADMAATRSSSISPGIAEAILSPSTLTMAAASTSGDVTCKSFSRSTI